MVQKREKKETKKASVSKMLTVSCMKLLKIKTSTLNIRRKFFMNERGGEGGGKEKEEKQKE